MRPNRARHVPALLAAVPVFVFLVVPTAIVLPVAFDRSQYITFPPAHWSTDAIVGFFNDSAWTSALSSSLQAAGIAMTLAVVVGGSAALALHGRRFPGKSLITGVVLAPMIVPAVVMALAFYQFFISIGMVGTILPIGLAHAVIATPYAFLTVRASLAGLNPALVRSASSLGAGPISVLRFVHLPVIRPGLIAGALFAFSVSIDETVIALFLQSPSATTLPVKMFTDIQYNLTPKIAVSSAMLVTVATLGLLLQVLRTLRHRAATRLLPLTAAADQTG